MHLSTIDAKDSSGSVRGNGDMYLSQLTHTHQTQEAMIDLHQMIKSQKRGLALNVVRRWSHQLLTGVAHLHNIHIMQRDLKPSNLLIYRDMSLKIGDFGLASEAFMTEAQPVRREMCTLWYRAPELIMVSNLVG